MADAENGTNRGAQTPSAPEEVFTRLLLANQTRIYGFILALVHDRAAASDVLQDVSVVLWRKFDRFEPGTDFAAWAMSVARLSIFEWRRRQKKLPLPLDDDQLTRLADEAVALSFDFEDRLGALRRCLQELMERDRNLLRLRYMAGETMTRIAELAAVSRVAIHKRMNRLHALLIECIRQRLTVEESE